MSPLSSIAHYRITSKLGEGGMGAVYRATDTRLNRDVAIKVLPPEFAEDAARMARFEREAQVLASLNHPNIAAIYGIEQSAIVMELVEGEDLKGPVPVDTVIDYARQIAAGLEAAHERGIVHRDLKPANIKVTPDGVVKLLDFGLAKVREDSAPTATTASPTMSPTLAIAMTQAGMILGTAAYMSPEQARGKPVDRRADIWAFGVILYELLTGKMLFGGGDTVSDSLAAVLTREPDWSALPANTPTHLRRLLERCLRRDSKFRLRDIGEARIVLEEPPVPEAPVATAQAPRRGVPWLALALTVAVAAVVTYWAGSRVASPPVGKLMRLHVDLGPDAIRGNNFAATISPDGSRIVDVVRSVDGQTQLATRLLEEEKASVLAGTEEGIDPFFSPDGKWIGFTAGSRLKKVPVLGGAAVKLWDLRSSEGGIRGAAWGADGMIVMAEGTTTGLSLLPDIGGTPQPLTDPAKKNQRTHRWPQFLPGGQSVLFTANTNVSAMDDAEIDVLDIKTREWKTVQLGGSFGRYLPSGHLIYGRRGSLYAVRFDLSRMEVSGSPVAVVEGVQTSAINGSGNFAAASAITGPFVYLAGKARDGRFPVMWLDAAGNTQPIIRGAYIGARISPDGNLLAISSGGLTASDLLVWDMRRGTRIQLTDNAQSNLYPVWTPDGKHLVFSSHSSALYTIWWVRSDGARKPVKLLEAPENLTSASISPDGRRLAYTQGAPGTGNDIWILPLDLTDPENPKSGRPEVFLQTPRNEFAPMFSPDGKWIAYTSDETGRREVFVRPFPGPGGNSPVSGGGGQLPVWSRAARQIFYVTSAGNLIVADYEIKVDAIVAGTPRPWAASRTLNPTRGVFDVSPDGKRVAGFVSEEDDAPKGNLHLTFLLNFFDELTRRVP